MDNVKITEVPGCPFDLAIYAGSNLVALNDGVIITYSQEQVQRTLIEVARQLRSDDSAKEGA
jgi:hypothetical protein